MTDANHLNSVWSRLACVASLRFDARSNSETGGWNGTGNGKVDVVNPNSSTMLFHESGSWTPAGGKQLSFTNVFRWTARHTSGTLRLEHLRFGENHPVYLFELEKHERTEWRSAEPHVCRKDLYTAAMSLDRDALNLHWTIKGPTKDEQIEYRYW